MHSVWSAFPGSYWRGETNVMIYFLWFWVWWSHTESDVFDKWYFGCGSYIGIDRCPANCYGYEMISGDGGQGLYDGHDHAACGFILVVQPRDWCWDDQLPDMFLVPPLEWRRKALPKWCPFSVRLAETDSTFKVNIGWIVSQLEKWPIFCCKKVRAFIATDFKVNGQRKIILKISSVARIQ